MIRYHTDDEGVVSQPEYTLPKPSNGPNDRDHLTRLPSWPPSTLIRSNRSDSTLRGPLRRVAWDANATWISG